MKKVVLDFLAKERVCCLSVIISENTPHGATVHFSHQDEPLKIYMQTSDSTVKAQPFLAGKSGEASIVVGFSEQDWLTLQMRGNIKRVTDLEELERIYKIHYQKHPEAEKYKSPKTVTFEFSPTWWRYSDFNTEPETIVSMEDTNLLI